MNFWVIVYRFSWVTLVAMVFFGIIIMSVPQFRQYQEYQRREQALQEQIQQERETLKHLKEKQERFKSDPRFVEMIAHEKGLAKPEETIFKFIDDEVPAPDTP